METFGGSAAGEAVAVAAPALRPRRRLWMLAVLGALSAFGPLSMDMYLPSTPTIAANLHAAQWLVQLTLSGCLAGLAVGQLVAGPLSDGLGRKKPLLAGLVAFSVLSVACAAAPDIGALIAFRFLQGMAGAVGVVLSLAMVRDLYEGTELARVLGSLMLVFGLAPVLAPVIGGQVLRFTSWRGVFGVLAAIGLVLLAATWFLPETRHPPLVALLVPLFCFVAAFGMMRPNATALALARQGAIAGTASAWLGALPFLLGAALSPLASLPAPPIGGQGAATVAGIMIGSLCVGGLVGQVLISARR